jgi:hypothetical protein
MVKKHIDMFTADQYEILSQTLSSELIQGAFSRKDAIRWLWSSWHNPMSKRSRLKFIQSPLSDMPLYINDPQPTFRIIALWRLKIAR